MSIALTTEPPPLNIDTDDVIRVGRTRVTLDTIVAAFKEGATAEEIAVQYPVLDLGDIYAVLGYYLRHQTEFESYFQRRQQQQEQVQIENERRFNPSGVRTRLLARRQRKDA